MCPQKLRRLPRQTVWMDEKGRIVIPKYLREAAGLSKKSWVEVLAEPNLENCKGLLLMKG